MAPAAGLHAPLEHVGVLTGQNQIEFTGTKTLRVMLDGRRTRLSV